MELTSILFPHEKVREQQDDMLFSARKAIEERKHMIIHAPTGIGKTTIIGPALSYALENNKRVFFLTSRHTQHRIAIDTLSKIKEKFSLSFKTADMIGKKWMCSQPGAAVMRTIEFTEFCKDLREKYTCEFYVNTREKTGKPKYEAVISMEELNKNPMHAETIKKNCEGKKLCPYEVASLVAANAEVIVADYYYMFHPRIRESFLQKHGISLGDCIIIVDEAHNLPDRIRSLMNTRISNFVVARAQKEAEKYGFENITGHLQLLDKILNQLSDSLAPGEEKLITKNDIRFNEEIISEFKLCGEEVKDNQRFSSIASIAQFLEEWEGEDEGFFRGISKDFKENVAVSYKCLDPSQISSDVINNSHCTIVMSATLNPGEMYADILGFPKGIVFKNYKSPFPKKNKLNLIIPRTTTKYNERNEQQYQEISGILTNIADIVQGNMLIIFPSYKLLSDVNKYFNCRRTVFQETPGMTKEEKKEMLGKFKQYHLDSNFAVLLAVASGSFSEGIDLPGVLRCVVIVGLPLQSPNLETKELIKYYDEKFGKGMDYGYIFPAMNKVIQGVGRCIRSEKDSGVLVFLDKRYIWHNYFRCFPPQWDIVVAKNYSEIINDFFRRNRQGQQRLF